MALKARYCSQCAAEVETRTIGDRPREVCPACGMVFYENPLPVAACLLLNADRHVLLVKRKRPPHKGEWCLPMGFAETGETIGHAARRELKEETGLEGCIVKLIDADSYDSSYYGDLLIVTFELQKTGGMETAGDDAEKVAYFPLDGVPPLAFNSNRKAVRFCIEAHKEEWAIQDSFGSLQVGETQDMLSSALVSLVEENMVEVTRLLMEDVRANPTTTSFRACGADELFGWGFEAITRFAHWLDGNEAGADFRGFWPELGRVQQTRGCPSDEMISALTLLKKHVWAYARGKGVWERPIDVYRVLELNRRIAMFFDKALYHTARGFDEAGNR
jgi:ADP-ribose pyrophosphatase YjhB (NUDIX family)